MNYSLSAKPLNNVLWQKHNTLIKQFLLMMLGVTLLAFASQLSIPLNPVPLTFQSATVLFIGMTFGGRRGALVILSYWIFGICGAPVFADYSFGIDKFFGPTGGYLLGFLPAAFISGTLAERGFAKHYFTSFIAALIGAAVIFGFGLSFLSHFVGFANAITLGLKPFIIVEPIKLLLLAFVIPKAWKSAK